MMLRTFTTETRSCEGTTAEQSAKQQFWEAEADRAPTPSVSSDLNLI